MSIRVTRATLVWNAEAEAVMLVLPATDPARPEWWQADQEVELYVDGENIVIRPLKHCEICRKDHTNRFTICKECENLS